MNGYREFEKKLERLRSGGALYAVERIQVLLSMGLPNDPETWEIAYKKAKTKFGIKRNGKKDPECAIRQEILKADLEVGVIKKEPCRVCGTTKRVCGHHPNYNDVHRVEWLCFRHHMEEHRRLKQQVS